jgi:hypothetical protein
MPIVDNLSVTTLLPTPFVWPNMLFGALAAALFVVLAFVILRWRDDVRSLFLSLIGFIVGVAVFAALLLQLAANNVATERRALVARNMQLSASALAPGSALSCLNGFTGEATESACEKALFADPQSVGRAVDYIAACLSLLREAFDFAHKSSDEDLLEVFASTRRMIELDHYGLAAQVLSVRDGCTLEQCYAFAFVQDASVLKANLKNQIFEQYVSRYSEIWNKAGTSDQQPTASNSSTTQTPAVSGAKPPPPPRGPVDSRWDFPSSASIPPVNIMTGEPAPAKEADVKDAKQAEPSTGDKAASVPVPLKRPETEAMPTPR